MNRSPLYSMYYKKFMSLFVIISQSNTGLYQDAGLTIASVMAVGAPPVLSAGVIAAIVVGGVVAILLILLILLLLILCCWKM